MDKLTSFHSFHSIDSLSVFIHKSFRSFYSNGGANLVFVLFVLFLLTFPRKQVDTTTELPDDLLSGNDQNNLSPWMKSDAKPNMSLLSPQSNSYRNMNGAPLDKNVLNSVLIGDTFLIDRMSPSFFVNPLTDCVPNSVGSSIDDDIMNMIKTNLDAHKPFESFDEQIIMTPPPPPPLEDGFVDSGMFHLNESLAVDRDLGMEYETQKQIGLSSPALSPGFSEDDDLFECNMYANNTQNDDMLMDDAWTDQMT